MIQVSNLAKSYGSRFLFEDVSFSVGEKERLGLVGRNGSGKSTLSKIILGLEEAEEGEVAIPKGYQLGYLNQHISFSEKSLMEECAKALPEEQKYDHYRVEKLLFGLGFEKEDITKDPRLFSGGYQLRINLTKSLLEQPNLLVLDEPTNYLDLPSLQWMRSFLITYPGEVILITHDRSFMDSIVSHTLGIHRKKAKKVEGPTSKYYEQVRLEEEIHEKTRRNQQKKVEQMQSFVDRFRAKASKATQAQSVLKKIEKMSVLSELEMEQALGFQFSYKESPAKRLMTVKNLSFAFPGNKNLFENLDFEVEPGDRIAIIGKNGKGKTTLLNVLSGQLTKGSGSIETHPSLEIGYYQQTNRKDLDPRASVEEEIERANPLMDYSQVRSICGAVMFPGDDAKKKIQVLSGGEQGRVLLGKILAKPHNLLLLDEPTNHLDMESIEILISEMEEFPGGILFVSHDERMLHQLANKFIIFHQGGARLFRGSYQDFLEKIGWEEEASKKAIKKKNKKDRAQRAQEVREQAKKKKLIESLESEIANLEASIKEKTLLAEQNQEDSFGLYKEIAEMQEKLNLKLEDWEKKQNVF